MSKKIKLLVLSSVAVTFILTIISPPSIVSALGEWLPSGSNLYFNTGNVGIGTDTPSGLLTLSNGGQNTSISQSSYGNANSLELLTSDASNNQASRLVIDGGLNFPNLFFLQGKSGLETPVFHINTDGKTGIGGLASSAAIHINQGFGPGITLEDTDGSEQSKRKWRVNSWEGELTFTSLWYNDNIRRKVMTLTHTGDVCIGKCD